MPTLCPCCSGFEYHNCCEPFHNQTQFPTTAQLLMRSRYSAYVLRDSDYLLKTWDITKRPKNIDFSKEIITGFSIKDSY